MLSDQRVRGRILGLNDADDDALTNIVRAGENEHQFFFLVILEREYQGNTYLNERYVALSKHDADEDTWMKNGINRRVNTDVDGMATTLARAYQSIANRSQTDLEEDRTPITEV